MVVRREMEGYSPAVSRRDLLAALMVAAVSLPLTFAITLAATILLDLTQAILLGFGISTLVFMAQISEFELPRLCLSVRFGRPGGSQTVGVCAGAP